MRLWAMVAGAALIVGLMTAPVAAQTTSLDGVIDFHVHSGPDSRPRSVSDLEIARIAKRAGMGASSIYRHVQSKEELLIDQLSELHLRLLGEFAEPDSIEVDESYALFAAVMDQTGGLTPEAWKVVLTALFQADRAIFY